MCRKYDIENNNNYYVSDFKRFVISEKDEDYLNMDNNRAQYLRKEWFCLKSTKKSIIERYLLTKMYYFM